MNTPFGIATVFIVLIILYSVNKEFNRQEWVAAAVSHRLHLILPRLPDLGSQRGSCHHPVYLSQDVSRNPSGHQDRAKLLQ